MTDALQRLLDTLTVFLAENPLVGAWYTTVVRFVFPLLALMILVGAIRSLWKVKHPDEVWGYLGMANGVRLPITHWENIIGRAPACDVQLEYPSVSRQHAALIREDDGSWTVYDLGSKGGVKVNDLPVDEYAVVEDGDTLSFGGIPTMLVPISAEEKREQMAERRVEGRPAGMWGSLVLLTLFQVLTALQLIVAAGENASVTVPLTFLTFTAVCWGYFIVLRSFRRIGFEMETIAFFLCTLSLAVTGSTVPDECPKQLVAILMGLAIFLVLGFFLRDLTRAQRVRWIMGAAAVGMLVITLLIATPIGIGAAIYLNEYARPGRLVKAIEFTTETLSGIPSIIFGLFGMVFFGNTLGLKYSILTGALTLTLMILPLITRTTQEALKTVPDSYRSGALGIGATKWYMIRTILLPSAMPGILTGVILAIGRIVGESAALLFTAGSGYYMPRNWLGKVMEPGGTLTIQLYLFMQKAKYNEAFGVAVVLLAIVLAINGLARYLSRKFNVETGA